MLLYVSVKTGEDGRVVAIAHRVVYPVVQPLRMEFASEHPKGSGGIVHDFCLGYSFWNQAWGFVPVGIGLDWQMGHLWRGAMSQGLLEFGADPWGKKPTIDLQHILRLVNSTLPPADDPRFQPPMFKDLDNLESMLQVRLKARQFHSAIKNGWLGLAKESLAEEAEVFLKIWQAFSSEAPAWWKNTLAAKVQG
jgi:hypothetical protein